MALLVHHGPSTFLSNLLLLLLLQSTTAQSTTSPPTSGSNGINLITAIAFITLIFALFFLGFFTAYLRRCIRNRTFSSDATVAAAAAAAFATQPPAIRRRRGLDQAEVESFPAVPYSFIRKLKPSKYGIPSPECSVCLGEFSDEEILRLLPGCRHLFHAPCIDTWLQSHVTCPVCRANLADPLVIAVGQCLLEDLAEEQLTDPVEIIVEVYRPDQIPDPDPIPEMEIVTVPMFPEGAMKEIDLAKRHRRAASLVSFQGARMSVGAVGSFIRTLSVSGNRVQGEGSRSNKRIRTGNNDVATESEVGSSCREREMSYEHSITFTGFVIRGDVAEDDWLPEIFQVSTAVQSNE
ncbi:hypothetical protein LUZ60_007239 [Juncus effusus]|nr:hypothetical protein LUZ60_007239 [Juncus effusus]